MIVTYVDSREPRLTPRSTTFGSGNSGRYSRRMSDSGGPDFAADERRDDRRIDVAIAVIVRGGRVLVCQRPPRGTFAGFWEFPGGKREPGERIADCLVREVKEELAIDVAPLHALRAVDHDYPGGRIRLHPYVCTHTAGEPQLLACQAAIWVAPTDLVLYRFPPANQQLIREAIEYLSRPLEPASAPTPSR